MVLDASAILALLHQESGGSVVADAVVAGAIVSAVNLSEVVAVLSDAGLPEDENREALASLPLRVVEFSAELAYAAGLLRAATRVHGLSFGDRACLALGRDLEMPVLTADRSWQGLDLGVQIRLIR